MDHISYGCAVAVQYQRCEDSFLCVNTTEIGYM